MGHRYIELFYKDMGSGGMSTSKPGERMGPSGGYRGDSSSYSDNYGG